MEMSRVLKEDIEIIIKEPINWEKLKGSSVLVTGASGMLGSYMMRTLLELNHQKGYGIQVFALVRNPQKLPAECRDEIQILQQDVTKPIVSDAAFDYIIHAASPASPLIMRKDPVGTIAANTLGAYNTLELASQSLF